MPFRQDEIGITGHAIEARDLTPPRPGSQLVAPSPGEISVYRPPDGIGIRVDGGVYTGATTSTVHQLRPDGGDEKLIAWAATDPRRSTAAACAAPSRAVRGEGDQDVDPLPPGARCAPPPRFVAGKYDTGLITTWTAARAARRTRAARSGAWRSCWRRSPPTAATRSAPSAQRTTRARAAGRRAAGGFGRRNQMRRGSVIYEVVEGKESVRVELHDEAAARTSTT